MRRTIYLGLFLSIPLMAGPVTAQPDVTGGRREFRSPPGWFGPGPAWHSWSDPGPGLGWSYYGVSGGPYLTVPPGANRRAYWPGWWGIPGAAGSFWTNGQSLYGPPVPTYGPIPGSFGGSDSNKHFFSNPPPANSVWVGLGWHGYRSPSPRRTTPSVNVYPPAPLAAPLTAPASDGGACIRLVVRLPDASADLWVEKAETKEQGVERVFQSPPLEAGATYRYDLVARWRVNGQEMAESRTAVGTPGQTILVDFTRPADAPAGTTAAR